MTKYLSEYYLPQAHCGLNDHAIISNVVIPPPEVDNTGGEDAKPPGLNGPSSFDAEIKKSGEQTYVHITWRDPYNDPEKTTYIIERVMNSDLDTLVKLQAYGNYYDDHSVIPGNAYQYRIQAYNSSKDLLSGWAEAIIIFP